MKLISKFKHNYPNLNAVIMIIAIVLIWRCVWSLIDIYLFPNNPLYSYITGGIIGIIILLLDDMKLDELYETPILDHESKYEHHKK